MTMHTEEFLMMISKIKAAGWSEAAWRKDVGVSPQTWCNWKKGKANPRAKNATKLKTSFRSRMRREPKAW